MRLLVYAGPNGSGKSSLRDTGALPDPVEVVIDPDRIARKINPVEPRAADRVAGKTALALFESSLAAGRSLSLETTLAGHSILRRLRTAKAAGYDVEL
jgi:predicted ABC-type ATPase